MSKFSNIGLFGGSFNPIHNGHLKLAKWSQKKLSIDTIFFIPAAIPPHKKHLILANAVHRYKMVSYAIEDYSDFRVSDIELNRKGISYTIDTIDFYRKNYKVEKENLFVFLGADSLIDLPNWREPDRILAKCQIVVFQRPNIDLSNISKDVRDNVIILETPLFDISSTEIRNRIKDDKEIDTFIPPAVASYIEKHSLYFK